MQIILDKLKEYLDVPAVTKFSEPFLKHLYHDFSKFEDYETILSNGLLVVRKKGGNRNKIFSVHIDRLGLVQNENGQVEHSNFWGKRKYNIPIETRIEIFDKMAYSFKDEIFVPYNLVHGELRTYPEVRVKYVKTDFVNYQMNFIFNNHDYFKDQKDVAFMLKNNFFFDGYFIGGQIDNAINAAILYRLVKDGFDGVLLFTCSEEIGLSWKHINDYLEDSQTQNPKLIVLDTTPYPNSTYFKSGKIVLRRGDSHAKFDEEFFTKLRGLIRQEKMSYAVKVMKGRTELGRLVKHTDGKYNGATLQIPTTNYHSNNEMTNLKCLKNFYKFLRLVSEDDSLFE